MVKVVFIDIEDGRHELDCEPGKSLMECAVENLVPGVEAECGGGLSCATCHVYVDESWMAAVGQPTNKVETVLIESLESLQHNSRLSCQIDLNDSLDGLTVTVAPAIF